MKPYQIIIVVVVFILIGYLIGSKSFASNKLFDNILNNNNTNSNEAGKVDLWCENGKYYKRTTTSVLGVSDIIELTRQEFDALISQGVSYSGCQVDNNGIITA